MSTRSYQLTVNDLEAPTIYTISFTDHAVSEISWDQNYLDPTLPMLLNQEGQLGTTLIKFIRATWVGNTGEAAQLKGQIPIKITTGTPFQRQVWHVISTIPLGQTKTYQYIAAQTTSPNAVRAVGSACGKNPLPLLIPCHRVTATHGLGGFGGGVHRKLKLLKFEGVQIPS